MSQRGLTFPKRRRLSPFAAGALLVLIVVGGIYWLVPRLPGVDYLLFDYDHTRAATPTLESAEVHERANAVFETFNGTVAQRNASALLQAWALNGATDTCMEAAGFPEWDYSSHRNREPRLDAFGASQFFSAPLSHSYSNGLRDNVDTIAAEERARSTRLTPEEYDAALECVESTYGLQMSDDEVDAFTTPPVARRLRDEWWSMLSSWDDAYGNVGRLEACVADGADARSLPSSPDGYPWQVVIQQMVPRAADIPSTAEGAGAGNAAWQRFVAMEADFEAVDWACRREVYEAHLDDVDDAVADFAADHREEIERARVEWLEVEQRAAQLPHPTT